MKKIILSTVAILAFGFANAQEVIVVEKESKDIGFTKGDKWIEGGFTYSSTSDKTAGLKSNFSFTPQMGYMVNDQWGVGGYLTFSGQDYNNVAQNSNNYDKTGSWGIGAFARYYFLSLGKDKSFQAYGELGLGYSALTKDYTTNQSSTTDSALNAKLNIGMNYFFTSHWAATFTLANILSYNNNSNDGTDSTSDFTINVNLFQNIFATPQFGLLYKW